MTSDLSTRDITEYEVEFLNDLRNIMDKHSIEIEYDPMDVPVFCDELGVGVFLSIHDIYLYLPKSAE